MKSSWCLQLSIVALGLTTLTACPHPDEVCNPEQDNCGGPIPDPPTPPLTEDEAKFELGEIHQALAEAAKDGLSPEECAAFGADYQALFERDPSLLAARFNVGALLERCGKVEEAEAVYLELAKRGDARALNNLGTLAWDRGQRERAFDLFRQAVDADRTHAVEARNNLGMALRERYVDKLERADFDLARHELENVLAVDTSNRVAYENLARLYYDRGRLEDPSFLILAGLVVTQGLKVLEANGEKSADLHNLRGLLWMQDENPVYALRAFQRALDIDSEHVDANRNVALIAIRFRDYDTAEQVLVRVIDDPDASKDPEVWNALGVARRGLRKYGEAEDAYRQALDVDKGDPRPWYNLGILAQEHLISTIEDDPEGKKLISVYEESKGYYETFIRGASNQPKLASAVGDAKDRIIIIDDTIETIEKMRALEDEVRRIEQEEQRRREARRKELLEKERQAQSGGQPGPATEAEAS